MARTTVIKNESSKVCADKDLTSMVQKKSYELYEKRGKRPGHAIDDWLEAERIVRQRSRF